MDLRTRILCIAPYEGMRTAIEQAAQAYPNVKVDVYTGDLEAGVAIVQRQPTHIYDCIISRGGTATMIRKVTELPVVDIQLSVYDVLRTMKLAENYSNLYAIVGFPSITEAAHTLCDLQGYKMDIITIHEADEVRQTLENLQNNGYRMVICDMITHNMARQMGLDAFLITSGVEGIHAAIDQAINISHWFAQLRQENLFLRSITQGQNSRVIVLDSVGRVAYSTPSEPSVDLVQALNTHAKEIPGTSRSTFYYNERDQLYSVSAQSMLLDTEQFSIYYCVPSRISLHSHGAGLRFLNKSECEYLLANSFFSISGAMGVLDSEIKALTSVRQPIMISGEPGTGKEQIARYLYLHSSIANNSFTMVNCALINEKSWHFLLDHYNSPLSSTANTVYFQNLESLSEGQSRELLATIQETGLARRVRLIFSCSCKVNVPFPSSLRHFKMVLGCLSLELPPLRHRSDEISSLASVYLGNLNLELGKQISGFEPRAIEMLREYDWPNNYTQFKSVLQMLATLTDSAYVRSSVVAEILAKERALHRNVKPSTPQPNHDQNLEEIITAAVVAAVAKHKGNRTAAAEQLGISRTTLWRYLSKSGYDDKSES